MERLFSMRTVYLVVAIAAGALSATYYLLKLRQECGATSLLGCVTQAFKVGAPKAAVEEARAPDDARKPTEPRRREGEEALAKARDAIAVREAAGARAADEARRRPEPSGLVGTWRGTYVCAQGPTGLTLTIEGSADALSAVFDFYPLPENPTLPAGRFSMSGTFDERSRVLTLRPGQWIVRPPPYMMVGMRAEIDLDRGVLSGTITDPACRSVRLTRLLPAGIAPGR